jgi:hypothetical protein
LDDLFRRYESARLEEREAEGEGGGGSGREGWYEDEGDSNVRMRISPEGQ